MNGWMDGWMDGLMDEWMGQQVNMYGGKTIDGLTEKLITEQ